jgi:hypothetical protein
MTMLLIGFYTIGPCGEELLSAVGANIRPTDPLALHYRHVAVSISRQLGVGQDAPGERKERRRQFHVMDRSGSPGSGLWPGLF